MTYLSKHLLSNAAVHVGILSVLLVSPVPAQESADDYFEMDLAQLMQMTVTSVAKKPQTLSDTPAAAFVITQEDIRRSGVTSLPEALAMVPGVQVAQISGGKWSVSSRGFGGYVSNKLLVMIDGRSVYTPAYSGTYWDMQHTLLEDIERIEVIRGPGGAIWGANAVNGVINIITKRSQDTLGSLVRVSGGNQEQFSLAGRHGTTIGESAFGRAYITTRGVDSNTLYRSEEDGYDGYQFAQGGVRLDGMLGTQTEWTVQGDLYKNDGDALVWPYWTQTPPYLASYYDNYTASGANLVGTLKKNIDDDELLTLKAYLDTNNRDEIFLEQTFTTLNADLQYEKRLSKRHSLTMGVGYRYIDSSFDDTFQVSLADATYNLFSGFLQDEITLIDKTLWFTLGTKYEHNDFTGSEWQPTGRILYKPADNHSLWGSIARTVRTPSIIEDQGRVTVAAIPTDYGLQTIHLVGNEELDAETSITYETGYRWQPMAQFSFDIALYYSDYEGILYGQQLDDDTSYDTYFVNAQDGEGYGVEVAANWQPLSRLSFNLAYSWQEISLDWINSEYARYSESVFESNTPKHQASLRSSYSITENIQLNCWLRYVDQISFSARPYIQDAITIPSYVLFDANIVWKVGEGVELMLAAKNLFNDSQLQYVTEQFTSATEIEGSVYGKLTWMF